MTRATSRERTADHPSELRIVVGVDGSDCGTRALEFAAHEAAIRGAILHIVSVYEDTVSTTPWPVVPLGLDQVSASAIVDESLVHVQEIEPAIVSKGEIRYGLAGKLLVSTSQNASLLVVGSRGRSEVASVLLGSVSEYCAHHSAPPVTVVR
jgi:nucleotide-binding universal stress UspA family protein